MALRPVTRDQVMDALRQVGIKPGDGLMVHSALQFLGRPEGGVGMYLEALCESLGIARSLNGSQQPASQVVSSMGTLAVPAFNFGFARGQPFDRQNTPSDGMGVFAEFVRQQPGVLRTTHPLQSIAVLGRYALDLCQRDTACAFDPGSAFDRMLELDFKVLLLGADIRFVSMVHYCEQKVGVPYRYWKDFTGLVRMQPSSPTLPPKGDGISPLSPGERGIEQSSIQGEGEAWETRTYRMYARDLQLDPQVSCKPAEQALKDRGLWKQAALNYGLVASFRMKDFVEVLVEMLQADPWALVQNRPENSRGERRSPAT